MLAQFRFSLFFLFLLSLSIVAFWTNDTDDDDSAEDDDDAADDDDASEMNLAEVAAADGRFTTLLAALEAADLATTIATGGPFTVFAPTDDAFAALPAGTVDALLADIPALTDILLYHVVNAEVDAAAVSGLVTATTLLGAPVNIDTSDGVVVGGATVTVADVMASNGIIHVIDTVLLPPPTIAEIAVEAGFTTLVAATDAADLTATIADPTAGPFTVFAPTDDAFAALPAGALDGLLADIPALENVLLYHLADGIVDSQAVVGLESAVMLNSDSVSIDASSGVVLNGSVNVSVTDIVARNGIIHVIDGVLLPSN
jgi:uncharacterized surface protein with fasciclin (FAS1) repeats